VFNLSAGDQVRVCWQGADKKPKGFNCEVLEVGEKALIVEVLVDVPRRIPFDRTTGQQIHSDGGEYWLEMPF
jgi:hypothetical protein